MSVSVHGEVQELLLFLLLRLVQTIDDEVPGQTDDPVTLHHVVPRHHQVVPVGQMSQFAREPSLELSTDYNKN